VHVTELLMLLCQMNVGNNADTWELHAEVRWRVPCVCVGMLEGGGKAGIGALSRWWTDKIVQLTN
jgi:hypothetical protein